MPENQASILLASLEKGEISESEAEALAVEFKIPGFGPPAPTGTIAGAARAAVEPLRGAFRTGREAISRLPLLEAGKAVITPIPQIAAFKRAAAERLPGVPLERLTPAIPSGPLSPLQGALAGAKAGGLGALLPVAQLASPRAAFEMSVPETPLEIGLLPLAAVPGEAPAVRGLRALRPGLPGRVPIPAIAPRAAQAVAGASESVLSELNRISDIVRRAGVEGVDPRFILTQSETSLYSRFGPQINASVQFRIPIVGITAQEAAEASPLAARLRPGIPEAPPIVAIPETVLSPVRPKAPIGPGLPPTPGVAVPRLIPGGEFRGQATWQQVKDQGARTVLEQAVEDYGGVFEAQRRGVIPDIELRRRAAVTGLTEDQVRHLRPGTILPAEKNLAARQRVADSAREIADLASVTDVADNAQKARFAEAYASHVSLQKAAQALESEAGRALRVAQISIEDVQSRLMREGIVSGLVEDPDKLSELLAIAKTIPPGDAAAAQRILQQAAVRNGTAEQVVEWITAMKLTGIATPFRNISGNVMGLMTQVLERPSQVFADVFRSAVTGTPRAQFLGEWPHGVVGMFRALPEASIKFWDALRGRLPLQRLEEATRAGELAQRGAVGKVAGKIAQVPFRIALSPDIFFKTLSFEFERSARAFARAAAEGFKGAQRAKRIEELYRAPHPNDILGAIKFSEEGTFMERLGALGRQIDKIRQDHPAVRVLTSLFYRTPVNLFKFFLIQRTLPGKALEAAASLLPKGFIKEPRLRTMLLSGDPRQVNQVMAELMTAAVTSPALITLAMTGHITGDGPKSARERATLEATGWRRRAIRIGDRYVSIASLEPLASPLALHANIAEAYMRSKGKEAPTAQAYSDAMLSTVKGFMENPFLIGPMDIIKAVEFGGKIGSRMLAGLLTLPLPQLIPSLARRRDEFMREADSVTDFLKLQIPGARETLPVQRDILGEPKRRETITPLELPVGRAPTDPVRKAIAELGIVIPQTANLFGKNPQGRPLRLSPEKFSEMEAERGRLIRAKLSRIVENQAFLKLPRDKKQRLIDRAVGATSESVRNLFERLARPE